MNYHNISHDDQNNGDGLRVVLWLSGCHHYCKNCQNQQTWNPDSGIEFDIYACNEIFEQLDKNYISGITLSGGDPLAEENLCGVLRLVNDIKKRFPSKNIWLYTGYTWDQIMSSPKRKDIVEQCDVIIDGPYIEEMRNLCLKWRGSLNQRVIDIKKSLQECKVVLWCD